jgi:hypothetical protein
MSNVLKLAQFTKVCNSCKQEKLSSEFTKNKAAPDGLQYKCRACDIEYQTKRRVENYQEGLEYSRTYQRNRRQNFDYRLQMLINASKQRAKDKNRELKRKLNVVDHKYNVSDEMINDYKIVYNTGYLRNWGLLISIIIVGFTISKIFHK